MFRGVVLVLVSILVAARAEGAEAGPAAANRIGGPVLAAGTSGASDRGPGWGTVVAGTLAGGFGGVIVGFALGRLTRGPIPESSGDRSATRVGPGRRRSWHAPVPADRPTDPPADDGAPPPSAPPGAERKREWEK